MMIRLKRKFQMDFTYIKQAKNKPVKLAKKMMKEKRLHKITSYSFKVNAIKPRKNHLSHLNLRNYQTILIKTQNVLVDMSIQVLQLVPKI